MRSRSGRPPPPAARRPDRRWAARTTPPAALPGTSRPALSRPKEHQHGQRHRSSPPLHRRPHRPGPPIPRLSGGSTEPGQVDAGGECGLQSKKLAARDVALLRKHLMVGEAGLAIQGGKALQRVGGESVLVARPAREPGLVLARPAWRPRYPRGPPEQQPPPYVGLAGV